MNRNLDTCIRHLDGQDCPVHGPAREKALFDPNHQNPVVYPTLRDLRPGREVRTGISGEHPAGVR